MKEKLESQHCAKSRYLNKHPAETNCPLCEKNFAQPLADVSRNACASVLKAQKAALVPPDMSKLEAAIALADQAKDFVQGLRDLTKRCDTHKIIKGR